MKCKTTSLNDFMYYRCWLSVFAFSITKYKAVKLQKTMYPNDNTCVRCGKKQCVTPLIWLQLFIINHIEFAVAELR